MSERDETIQILYEWIKRTSDRYQHNIATPAEIAALHEIATLFFKETHFSGVFSSESKKS